jgi:hypothetical protein
MLSAYLRYFLPWNVYRLCRLLPALPLHFAPGDAIIDLGSGPLTLVISLWIGRPDLRELPLEFRCVDRTAAALDAGKRLFYTLAGDAPPWVIKPIRASLGDPLYGPKARLVSAVNVFNEVFGALPRHTAALQQAADKTSRLLSSLTAASGSILALEPGIPRSGECIAALRAALLEQGQVPCSPCPHRGTCPCPGGKAKWCHFAFDTEDAPAALHTLSAAAGLPKERATLSFLLTGPGEPESPQEHEKTLLARIFSDPFPVPGRGYGRYGCSSRGLILALDRDRRNEKNKSGALVSLTLGSPEKRDPKTGALLAEFIPSAV